MQKQWRKMGKERDMKGKPWREERVFSQRTKEIKSFTAPTKAAIERPQHTTETHSPK